MKRIPVIMIASLFVIGIPAITQSDPVPKKNGNKYVLYEKRPVMGKFKKPVFDEVSRCYRIQWSDMAYLTESIVVDKMYVSPKG